MTAAPRRWAGELLHFWFEKLGPAQWWGGSSAIDSALRKRFARELAMLGSRPAREFLRDPLTARAAVLLFDQLPRNLYRKDGRAFAHDRLARQIARGLISRGWHRRLSQEERAFAGMPLMHSESIVDQRASLAYFRSVPSNFAFARAHYRMIARFGRFPHRNPVIGRASSAAEQRAVAAGNAW